MSSPPVSSSEDASSATQSLVLNKMRFCCVCWKDCFCTDAQVNWKDHPEKFEVNLCRACARNTTEIVDFNPHMELKGRDWWEALENFCQIHHDVFGIRLHS
jgi:hypothetical protein